MCGRDLQGSEYEWRVKIWNDDSISYTAVIDWLVCALCTGRAAALLCTERTNLRLVGANPGSNR